MAGLIYKIHTSSEVALSAGTARTLLHVVASANVRIKILGWGIFFDGKVSGDEPVVVAVVRQIGGTGTLSSAANMLINTVATETMQTTCKMAATAEPTTVAYVERIEVHPQSGYQVYYPFGQELILAGGNGLGIIATAPQAVNALAQLIFEE